MDSYESKIISPKLAVALVLTGILSGVNTSVAKEREWVIKSNDTLSKIVERYYPSIRNKKAVIRAIVQDNPNAFRRGNAHDLILGKVLILPEPDRFKIPPLKQKLTVQRQMRQKWLSLLRL